MLKKETRLLGLSVMARSNGKVFVIGTVFRGRSWLDSILTCCLESETSSPLSKLSRTIIALKQYSQLHAVILSKKKALFEDDVSIADLSRRVKLPVISIIKKAETKKAKKWRGVNQYKVEVNGEHIQVLAKGTSREKIRELFALSSAPKSCVPEAARVADLIAEQVTLKWNSLGLA